MSKQRVEEMLAVHIVVQLLNFVDYLHTVVRGGLASGGAGQTCPRGPREPAVVRGRGFVCRVGRCGEDAARLGATTRAPFNDWAPLGAGVPHPPPKDGAKFSSGPLANQRISLSFDQFLPRLWCL